MYNVTGLHVHICISDILNSFAFQTDLLCFVYTGCQSDEEKIEKQKLLDKVNLIIILWNRGE